MLCHFLPCIYFSVSSRALPLLCVRNVTEISVASSVCVWLWLCDYVPYLFCHSAVVMNVQIQIQTHASLDSRKFSLAFSFFLFNFFFVGSGNCDWCVHIPRGVSVPWGLAFPGTPSTAANKHFTFEYAPLLVRRFILLYFARTRICAYLLYIQTLEHRHTHTQTHTHRDRSQGNAHMRTLQSFIIISMLHAS